MTVDTIKLIVNFKKNPKKEPAKKKVIRKEKLGTYLDFNESGEATMTPWK